MKKKIGLFLGSTLGGGGTFQYNQSILDAVAALPVSEFEVVVGYSHHCWEHPLARYGITAIPISLGVASRAIGRLWRLLNLPLESWRAACPYFHPVARALLSQRCDLWIFPSQDHWTYQIPVPALGVVLDLMHRYERRFPEVSANGEYERREYQYRAMCRWARALLTESELGKQQLIESYGIDAARVYSLPTIAPRYMHVAAVPADFDTRYKLPSKYVFYPAQFWEHKNHARLIKAAASLRQRIPDLQLVFVGAKKNGYAAVRALVTKLNFSGNVQFLGLVPDEDMPELYRRARALVMPSFFGPTNIPPLEAFVAGCPVAISGIYSAIEQVGDAALMFDPDSETEIADCLFKLWTDDALCAELIRRGLLKSKSWNQAHFNERLYEIVRKVTDV